MGSTLFAVVNGRSDAIKGSFGHRGAQIREFIDNLDETPRHYRDAKAADAAWGEAQSILRKRYSGTFSEAHDALKDAGKLNKAALRAVGAIIARDYIEAEAYSILLAPFVALGSAVAA